MPCDSYERDSEFMIAQGYARQIEAIEAKVGKMKEVLNSLKDRLVKSSLADLEKVVSISTNFC